MIEYLQTLPEPLVYTFVFIFSLLVGSFLNVIIYRLPIIMEADFKSQAKEILGIKEEGKNKVTFNLIVPRSKCRGCNKFITSYDNIPIISYILVKGKCRNCNEPISIFYPIVELITAVSATIAFYHFGINMQGVFALFFIFFLISISGIDLKVQLLPDSMTITLMWIGFLYAILSKDPYIPLSLAVVGAAIAYMSFWIISYTFIFLTKKEGMGLGDAKLVAALSAWIDIHYLPTLILIACMSGLIFAAISRIFSGKKLFNNPIPFGPHLAIAGYITFLYGHGISEWYYNLLSSIL